MPPRIRPGNRPSYNRDLDSDSQLSDSGSEYEDSTSSSSSDSSYKGDSSSNSGDESDLAGEAGPSGTSQSTAAASRADTTRATFAIPFQRGARRATTSAAAQTEDANSFDSDLDDEDLDRTLFQGNLHPPEYWKLRRQETDENAFARKCYSEKVRQVIDTKERQWREFCETIDEDWENALDNIDVVIVVNFHEWYLNQRTGKNGRTIRGIKKRTSLRTFWDNFRMFFHDRQGSKLNHVIDCSKVQNAIHQMGEEYELSSDKRMNRSMSLGDLKTILDTVLRTTDMSFHVGEFRILNILFPLLMAPAGSRPNSICQLRFGDIQVLLARDPNNGPHRLLIRFTLKYTKTYLGSKDVKTFFVPEIIYDPSLLLCPHVILLGILCYHRAFVNEGLNDDPHSFAGLDIYDGENELLLPLKAEFDDMPVFRQPCRAETGGHYVMGTSPVHAGTMTTRFTAIGELAGYEHNTISYGIRYGAGNTLDQNINVSDSLRNLVLDHRDSTTFREHYLSRWVCMDAWAVYAGSTPQQDLLNRVTGHGHSRSDRRDTRLSAQQIYDIEHNPTVIGLKNQLRDMRVGARARYALTKNLHRVRMQLRRFYRTKNRKAWTKNQAIQDIAVQLQGQALSPLPDVPVQPTSAAHKRLIEALEAPLIIDLEAQRQRRAAAIQAVKAYCHIHEPRIVKLASCKPPPPPPELRNPGMSRQEQLDKLRKSVIVSKVGQKLSRCFLCVSKALELEPDDSNIDRYCRDFSRPADAARHFRNVHLAKLEKNAALYCGICSMWLKGHGHIQNHAEAYHGMYMEQMVIQQRRKQAAWEQAAIEMRGTSR
ncbi:C2H2 finger domain protein [Xylaria sp. FL0933]|nr:C2H2 finger domain protein [Xylaria sp. FL0933]